MPYLEPHGDGWRVCWRDGGRGSKIRKSRTFGTKTAAADELAARRLAERARRAPGGIVMTWADVRARWILHLTERGRTADYLDKAKRTLERCTGAWSSTTDATPSAMSRLRLGPWRLAKACLRWSRTYLGQTVDHAAVARFPGQQRRAPAPDLLTDRQVAALVRRARQLGGAHGELLAHLVATYGHRPQSLVAMRVEDIELRAARISMPVKSGDRIRHPVLPATVRLLRAAVAKRAVGPVILDPDGRPWANGQRASAWFWHTVGKGVGIYQLKSYAISRMLAGGLDLKTIASITGHRTPAVLLRYARVNEDRQRVALKVIGGGRATPVLPKRVVSH